MEDCFVPENLIKSKVEMSPSGRFKLEIQYYKTGPKSWDYTRGIVTRLSDEKVVFDIRRNYPVFHHAFFTKAGKEYLIGGRKYIKPDIYALDDEQHVELNYSESWYWARMMPSPLEDTIAVIGCIWGGPYHVRFWDIDSLLQGQLEEIGCGLWLLENDDEPHHWQEDGTFAYYEKVKYCKLVGKEEDDFTSEDFDKVTEEEYEDKENWEYLQKKIVLRREGNSMVQV